MSINFYLLARRLNEEYISNICTHHREGFKSNLNLGNSVREYFSQETEVSEETAVIYHEK